MVMYSIKMCDQKHLFNGQLEILKKNFNFFDFIQFHMPYQNKQLSLNKKKINY